jgi:hypothetical protein
MAIKEENSIGFRIVQAFNAKDLKEVAQIIGENYSSLHNWASQRRDFPTNVLIKIAKMANISIEAELPTVHLTIQILKKFSKTKSVKSSAKKSRAERRFTKKFRA